MTPLPAGPLMSSGQGDPTVERYERLLTRLSGLAEALATASDLNAIYRLLLDFVRQSAPCNGMFVALFDPSRQERRCVYAWSEGHEEDVSLLPPLPMTDSPNSRAVLTGEIVVADDFQHAVGQGPGVDLGMDVDPRLPQSSLAVPMRVMGRVLGAVEIQSVERSAYAAEHVTALRMAASLCGMATENVRLLEDERRLRRQAEESERRKAAILASAVDAIITIDHEGRIAEFNPAAERMFGYRPEAAIGSMMDELIVPLAFRRQYRESITRPLAQGGTGATSRCVEMPALRSDGSEFPAEFSITRTTAAARPTLTGFVRDLTERRRAEHARESLEVQLRESQKMQAIGTLAGGIAHDFNNILAAILGNAELAEQAAADNPFARDRLAEIRNAGRHGRDLVQRILSFSRRQPVSRRPIAPAEAAEESLRLLKATLPAGVEVSYRCAPDLPAILADPTQIEQILLNLGTNAAHALGGAPGRIELDLDVEHIDEETVFRLRGLRSGRHVRLTFSDTGCGMDAATAGRIFEPFFSTKPVGEGTGLGLAVVHGIVHDHDGAIVVESQPGTGTRFQLYFPALDAATVQVTPQAPVAERRPGRGQRILHIDDDEALVDLFGRLLQRAGYLVVGHVDAREGLDALRADPSAFDLVITDFNMPRFSGLDVAREVHRICPGLPVVVASGCVTAQLREQAEKAGVAAVISKPHAVEELPRIVQRFVPVGARK